GPTERQKEKRRGSARSPRRWRESYGRLLVQPLARFQTPLLQDGDVPRSAGKCPGILNSNRLIRIARRLQDAGARSYACLLVQALTRLPPAAGRGRPALRQGS